MSDTPRPDLHFGDFATKLTPERSVPPVNCTPDELSIWHLANHTLLVDTETGCIYKSDGTTRAETPRPDGYGIVYLGRPYGRLRWGRAHRIVWIAEHGPIPGMYTVNHRNGRRWDNRISNLDLATHRGNMRHAHRLPYEHIPGVPFLGEEDRHEPPPPVIVVTRNKRRYSRYD
jgi:hypothetical protein